MTKAEAKRLEVLRRIHDVIHHPTGPRIYETMTRSLSVRPEVEMLLQQGLIEACDRDGEQGYRRTTAGDQHLTTSGGTG